MEAFFIESIKDYVNIKTENQEYIFLDTLKSLENQLPKYFSRVHRSYIINKKHIKNLDSKSITLMNDLEIPIGESYKMTFMKHLK